MELGYTDYNQRVCLEYHRHEPETPRQVSQLCVQLRGRCQIRLDEGIFPPRIRTDEKAHRRRPLAYLRRKLGCHRRHSALYRVGYPQRASRPGILPQRVRCGEYRYFPSRLLRLRLDSSYRGLALRPYRLLLAETRMASESLPRRHEISLQCGCMERCRRIGDNDDARIQLRSPLEKRGSH